jgi:hypothetical protein
VTNDVWTVEKVRALPLEARPAGSSVLFTGGMMYGKAAHLPTTVDDGRSRSTDTAAADQCGTFTC